MTAVQQLEDVIKRMQLNPALKLVELKVPPHVLEEIRKELGDTPVAKHFGMEIVADGALTIQ